MYFCTVNPLPGIGGASLLQAIGRRRQGTNADGHHKIQNLIFMITIESLVEQGANVKLEVTPADLKMFAESIVQRTIMAQQEER